MQPGEAALNVQRQVLSGKGARRDHRFKDSFRGNIEYLGAFYLCLADDISQRGVHLISGAAVDVGDRVIVHLSLSPEVKLSCVIEVRHVNRDGLGAEIVYISHDDAYVLSGRIEEHYATQIA